MKKVSLFALLSSSLAFASSLVTATEIDFTEAEGYNAATLNGQQGWTGSTGYYIPAWYGETTAANLNFADMYYGGETLDTAAGTITYALDFNFTYDLPTVATNINGMSVKLSTSSTSANTTNIGLNYSTTGNFVFFYFSGAGSYLAGNGLAPTALGLNAATSDYVSDSLRITVEMTKGATASDWTLTTTLYNIDTDTVLRTISSTAGVTSEAFFSADSIFAGFNSGANSANGGYSEFNVERFEITSVPEPAGAGFALGAIGLLFAFWRMRARKTK
ncbi:MAG: hypothetical protein Q7Q73_06840 [Verrucomicrobiota bacterium JB024]|jgi:hypothetical protein|nr:hypothetical protein [Verrucomicrobiota bacterium JB024]